MWATMSKVSEGGMSSHLQLEELIVQEGFRNQNAKEKIYHFKEEGGNPVTKHICIETFLKRNGSSENGVL